MKTLHFPAKKKESRDGDRNSLKTMPVKNIRSVFHSTITLSKRQAFCELLCQRAGFFSRQALSTLKT